MAEAHQLLRHTTSGASTGEKQRKERITSIFAFSAIKIIILPKLVLGVKIIKMLYLGNTIDIYKQFRDHLGMGVDL